MINIKCEECKWEYTLQEQTVFNMAVPVDGTAHVIPCLNPKCNNNIPISIEEKKDA